MKSLFFLGLLFPLLSLAQSNTYYSAEAGLGLSKGFDNNSYGLALSGNIGLSEKLFLGVSGGAIKITPFLKNVVVPVSLRATIFPFSGEETTAIFALRYKIQSAQSACNQNLRVSVAKVLAT